MLAVHPLPLKWLPSRYITWWRISGNNVSSPIVRSCLAHTDVRRTVPNALRITEGQLTHEKPGRASSRLTEMAPFLEISMTDLLAMVLFFSIQPYLYGIREGCVAAITHEDVLSFFLNTGVLQLARLCQRLCVCLQTKG